jgi:hypothetical protein
MVMKVWMSVELVQSGPKCAHHLLHGKPYIPYEAFFQGVRVPFGHCDGVHLAIALFFLYDENASYGQMSLCQHYGAFSYYSFLFFGSQCS